MTSKSDATNLDLYGTLGVDRRATDKQILTAYRKQALKCHPDKNPDNPKAVERFHLLSKALELLTDAAARAAYDKVLDAKAASAARHHELDSQRKKFKEDLEAREKAAEIERLSQPTQKKQDLSPEERLRQEIDRLREEGSALLKAEQARMKEELSREEKLPRAEATPPCTSDSASNSYMLRIKWKAGKTDPTNGGYSEKLLESIFQRCGEVNALLVPGKRKGTAVVDLSTYASALLALKETGLEENPLTVDWLTQPLTHTHTHTSTPITLQHNSAGSAGTKFSTTRQPHSATHIPSASTMQDEKRGREKEREGGVDFESIVLMRMREAEEKKRIARQLEDADVNSL